MNLEDQQSYPPKSKRSTDNSGDNGQTLQWVCHPVKRKPLVSVMVTLLIILISVLIFYSTGSQVFTVLGLVILSASLAKFYFPTRYYLTEQQLMIQTTTQKLTQKWTIYRSCYPDKKGILLSPFTEPSRLENFRGLYLMFNDNGEEVTAFIRERLKGCEKTQRL